MISLLVGLALAQSTEEPEASEEVIVYGRMRVEAARQEVIDDLGELGYSKIIEKEGAIVLRHDSPWKGDVWLHDDGWMRIKRQPVRVEAPKTPWGKKNSPGAWLGCIAYPFMCIRPGGQTVGRRKFMAVETKTAAHVGDEVSTWGDRVADLAADQKAGGLPDRLYALWEHGTPLRGDQSLATPAERRTAMLAYWESRTDTVWGERLRATVEAFILGEVQHSDHPFTPAEIDAFNRRSRAGRPLDLARQLADDG